MTRAQFAKARKTLRLKYEKECNALARAYFKENVPLKKMVVYEVEGKQGKGLTNRFVVFIIQVTHYMDVGMFDVKAGVWWLDKENKCAKWETLHGVDNPNGNRYTRSKNQMFIKPPTDKIS